jgi:hypothetical protein
MFWVWALGELKFRAGGREERWGRKPPGEPHLPILRGSFPPPVPEKLPH